MDGGDQDGDGGWSTVEFEKRSDPCAHTSQPIEYELTCHIRQKVSQAFSFNCKIEKGLYVCTLSGLEEWGLLFN